MRYGRRREGVVALVDYRSCGEFAIELQEPGRSETRTHLSSRSREVWYSVEPGDELSVTAEDLAAPDEEESAEADERAGAQSSSASASRPQVIEAGLVSAEAPWEGPVPWRDFLKGGSRITPKEAAVDDPVQSVSYTHLTLPTKA